MPMIDDQETLQIFLEDAREHLSGIENDFLAIEAAGTAVDVALVNKVFRAVHSIKGGAGFLGLDANQRGVFPFFRSGFQQSKV